MARGRGPYQAVPFLIIGENAVKTVPICSEMVAMLGQPPNTYRPEWPDAELLPETRDPQASLENCRRLLFRGLTYQRFIAGPGGVMIVFETGETLLCNGFALGEGPRAQALATLAAEIGLGTQEEMTMTFEMLGEEYHGPLPRLEKLAGG
jgi:hypothetical protein